MAFAANAKTVLIFTAEILAGDFSEGSRNSVMFGL
jgi:hypothetical protein